MPHFRFLLIPLLVLAFATPSALAQAEPSADLLRVGKVESVKTAGFQEQVDAVLNPVVSAIETALFFDIAFGTLRSPKLNDAGQPVFEQQPVMVEAETAFEAVRVGAGGNVLLDAEGQPRTVEIEPGMRYQPVGLDGMPSATPGEPVIEGAKLPFLVIWLGLGAVFYTVYHGFINLRGFGHAWAVVRGKYQAPEDAGEIPPFKALTSALSATVGLGNIAGVAIAMVTGGPGALFWMMFLGLFGMTSKFHETTLSQIYRQKNPDGSISGGPMFFLDRGLAEKGPAFAVLGKVLAVVFAIFLMGAALGGGNMFQSNQAFEAFFSQFVMPHVAADEVPALQWFVSVGFGLLMAVTVGVVVIGGIARIGSATAILVPFMAILYVLACTIIVINHATLLPELIGLVLHDAFAADAAVGGFLGAMIVGFQRAAFSSEAGIGSSAVAHAAAQTNEPVREGLVASLEPFIDTIVICFMTGMVVLITGAYRAEGVEGGAAVTLWAFEQRPIMRTLQFPTILTICIILFAFSTMISWCYYGERAWSYLFGTGTLIVWRLLFVAFVFLGAVASLGSVIGIADTMLLSCALPNILGGVILAPQVKRRLKDYWSRYKAGGFPSHAADYDVHESPSRLND